jgi:hypothetical protein
MDSAVMDPSLELQQLASQALQFQAAQNAAFTQQSQSPISFGSEGKSGDGDGDGGDAGFFCPFPNCNRHYKRKDLLKRHLTTLLASQDENHRDDAVWANVKEAGVMTIYTRPRNLSEDQKKLRRKESNLRHRVKYAQELKEKRNRKRRVEKLLEGKQVGVQTPDWEAEAEAEARANAAIAAMSATQMDMVEEPEAAVIAEPRPRGRRGAKKQ